MSEPRRSFAHWLSRRVLRLPLTKPRVAHAVDDEIAFHVQERIDEFVERGMSPAEAAAEAQRRFGDVGRLRGQLVTIDERARQRSTAADVWAGLTQDIRFAARSASFGAVFIKRGVSACDMGTSYHLPRLVGASRSAELLLTGRVFDAAEAERIGLVLDVVDDGTVLERALVTAREIATNSPLAVWMTKETMWQTVDSPSLRHALDLENRTQIMCTATGELTEAFTSFREGRVPSWNPL